MTDFLRFKDILSFGGDYKIDDTGQIYSKRWNRLLKQSIDSRGYKRVRLGEKLHMVHRLVAITFLPNLENKAEVDHINGNKLDNRVKNLRWATRSENMMNKCVNKNNKLGIKGVSETKSNYIARIKINGEEVTKCFQKNDEGLQEALEWRKQKEIELHGEFRKKN